MGGCAHYCHLTDNNTNNNVTTYYNLCNLIRTLTAIAKADSGATFTYWREEDKHLLSKINPITHQRVTNGSPTGHQRVTLPNNTKVKSTEGGIINLSEKLPLIAQKATIVPDLTSSLLISLGQLADDDCTIFK